jgi:hypothetical protein
MAKNNRVAPQALMYWDMMRVQGHEALRRIVGNAVKPRVRSIIKALAQWVCHCSRNRQAMESYSVTVSPTRKPFNLSRVECRLEMVASGLKARFMG